MLNLFVMVLLQGLDDHYNNPESSVDLFNRTVRNFKLVWNKYALLTGGVKISSSLLMDFLYDLGEPLGVSKDTPRKKAAKLILILEIPEQEGQIYYHSALYCIYKHTYGKFRMSASEKY